MRTVARFGSSFAALSRRSAQFREVGIVKSIDEDKVLQAREFRSAELVEVIRVE